MMKFFLWELWHDLWTGYGTFDTRGEKWIGRGLMIVILLCVLGIPTLIGFGLYEWYIESNAAHACEARNGEWGITGYHWGYMSHGKSGSRWETIDEYGCREYQPPK